MSGVSGVCLRITIDGLEAAIGAIAGLAELDEDELLTAIGAEGESQTRRRIEEEKTAPDGTPWKPNRAGTPILLASGNNLRDSVAYVVGAGYAEWGASWEYAHVHQDGAVIKPRHGKALKFWWVAGGHTNFAVVKSVTIPARPFVGLSDDNRRDIHDVVTDFLGVVAGGRR